MTTHSHRTVTMSSMWCIRLSLLENNDEVVCSASAGSVPPPLLPPPSHLPSNTHTRTETVAWASWRTGGTCRPVRWPAVKLIKTHHSCICDTGKTKQALDTDSVTVQVVFHPLKSQLSFHFWLHEPKKQRHASLNPKFSKQIKTYVHDTQHISRQLFL